MKIEFVELDLNSLSSNWQYVALVVLVALVGLGWLGKTVTSETSEGSRVLSWSEWEIRKARQTYGVELGQLQKDTDDLAGLINGRPDAVRAQVVSDRIVREEQNGQAALEVQRAVVAQASEAVRAWAVGSGTHEEAQIALQNAMIALQEAQDKLTDPEAGQ